MKNNNTHIIWFLWPQVLILLFLVPLIDGCVSSGPVVTGTATVPHLDLFVESHYQPKLPEESMPAGMPSDVREQISKLYSPNAVERVNAAYVLGDMRERAVAAIPFLINILGDDTEVNQGEFFGIRRTDTPRGSAGRALAKIGRPSLVPLIAALKDEDNGVRAGAASALGETKDEMALEPLIHALNDESSDVRSFAAYSLANIMDHTGVKNLHAVEPLIIALKDEKSSVRYSAAVALFSLKDLRSVEPLIVALEDKDDLVRRMAASSLGEIGDKQSVPFLIDALKDEDCFMKRVAARALGKIGDLRAVEPLIPLLGDKDKFVRKDVAEALAYISEKDFGEDQLKWQKWWEETKSNSTVRNTR